MTIHSLSQSPEAGAISNVIDLAAERAIRRPVDPFEDALERCAELSAKVWSELEKAGYPRPAHLPENPLMRQLGARGQLKRMMNPAPASTGAEAYTTTVYVPQPPDLSGLTFEECAALLKSIGSVHFSGSDDILNDWTQPMWSHVLDRLRAFNDKRYDRVVESAINQGDRKRLRFLPLRRWDNEIIQPGSPNAPYVPSRIATAFARMAAENQRSKTLPDSAA